MLSWEQDQFESHFIVHSLWTIGKNVIDTHWNSKSIFINWRKELLLLCFIYNLKLESTALIADYGLNIAGCKFSLDDGYWNSLWQNPDNHVSNFTSNSTNIQFWSSYISILDQDSYIRMNSNWNAKLELQSSSL